MKCSADAWKASIHVHPVPCGQPSPSPLPLGSICKFEGGPYLPTRAAWQQRQISGVGGKCECVSSKHASTKGIDARQHMSAVCAILSAGYGFLTKEEQDRDPHNRHVAAVYCRQVAHSR